MRILQLLLLGFVLPPALTTTAVEWPQFRGPQASGVDPTAPAPIRWDLETGENVQWRTPIPGLAHSSPIVWGGRIYVATAVRPGKAELKVGLYGDIESAADQAEHEWRLLSLERSSGRIVWNVVAHQGIPRVKRHPKSSHCSSTPATDGKHIVAILGSEGLFCFDLNGKLLWKKDLGLTASAYFQVPSAEWGFASSPVIHEGKVVVLCDVLTNSYVAAFAIEDGAQIWRTPRKDVPTWGTPALATYAGKTLVLVNGWHHSGGYDFDRGRELWRLDGGGDIPVPTPVVADDLAYFTSAHGRVRPMRAIRLDATGDITPREPGGTNGAIVWAHARQGNYMQTPIVVGGNLYGCLDSGILTCFDAKTGAIRYSERLSNGSEGFTSSPVSDGKNLFFASEMGNVFVVPATGKFSVIATNRLEETCMATPALSKGTLYYRTREHLVSIAK